MISNVWYPFYNHSLGAHYGNFSSITGKLYNESDDKLASQAEICILIQLSKSFSHGGAGRDVSAAFAAAPLSQGSWPGLTTLLLTATPCPSFLRTALLVRARQWWGAPGGLFPSGKFA